MGWRVGNVSIYVSTIVSSLVQTAQLRFSYESSGDLISSAVAVTKPSLECPIPDYDASNFPQELQTIVSPSIAPVNPTSFCTDIRSLMGAAAKLATLDSALFTSITSTTSGVISLSQLCSALEHRLLSLQLVHPTQLSQRTISILVHDACRIAILISMTYHFRDFKPHSATFRSLRAQLIGIIEKIGSLDEGLLDEGLRQMLLWACWMGGMASTAHDWFPSRIQFYMQKLHYTCWEELEGCMVKFIWTLKMHDSQSLELWRAVQAHKSSILQLDLDEATQPEQSFNIYFDV